MARKPPSDAPRADELSRLYGAGPDRFTSERDALARELRGSGRAAAAQVVKALRKPPLAVWIVDQLARRHPRETSELLDAGAEVASAQAAALAGKGGDALRSASERQRAAVAVLAGVGAKLLAAEGHPEEPTLQRVRRTLLALPTASDEEREQVRAGILDHELQPAAFGALLGDGPAPPRPPPRREPERPAPAPARRSAAELARAKKELAQARAEVQEAEHAARAGEKRRAHAAQQAERARVHAEAAEREAAGARAHAERAEAELEKASAEAAAAQQRVDAARAALRELPSGGAPARAR